MHAVQLLHTHLQEACPEIHTKRLHTLIAAVCTLTRACCLTVTALGRALDSATSAKHNIKRIDRLVGNPHLLCECPRLYGALTKWLITGIDQPVILVDWSDLTPDRQWQLLRAAIPVGGRALTLYEEVHPLKRLGNRRVHRAFLKALQQLLPKDMTPILVTDAGFRTTWFQQVDALGWCWVGRIRGRDYVRYVDTPAWVSCKQVFAQATQHPKTLGLAHIVRSNPTLCTLHLVRRPKRGRTQKSRFGQPVRCRHSQKNAAREREPWLIAASTGVDESCAKQVMRLYRQRMQIEEAFRDLKCVRYGLGLSLCLTRDPHRLQLLLLIGALALFVLWLTGCAACANQQHLQFQSNTTRNRTVLSVIYLAMLILGSESLTPFTKSQLLAPIKTLRLRLNGIIQP